MDPRDKPEDDARGAEDDDGGAVLLSNKVNYWTGTECREFEKEFAGWCGTRYQKRAAENHSGWQSAQTDGEGSMSGMTKNHKRYDTCRMIEA